MSKRNLLVVDDEEFIRDLLEEVFSRAGYVVRSAESAEEALEVLKEDDIHVMFLDLTLPGMNGVELCRKLRRDRPRDIICALTGDTSIFKLANCREAGFDEYFQKPVGLKTLLKAASDAYEKIERWENKKLKRITESGNL